MYFLCLFDFNENFIFSTAWTLRFILTFQGNPSNGGRVVSCERMDTRNMIGKANSRLSQLPAHAQEYVFPLFAQKFHSPF